jgi:hypothetical protein
MGDVMIKGGREVPLPPEPAPELTGWQKNLALIPGLHPRRRKPTVVPPEAEAPGPQDRIVRVCSLHHRVCLTDWRDGKNSGVYCPGKTRAAAHVCDEWFTVDRETGKVINEASAMAGAILEVEP